ncbi:MULTISPECIES: hypothetical protein [Methylobacterium]|uniref:Uncharacterized protein n=1 Tax=Methylobacterium jeotgali TaxID=381630 RepID=A0ABQ4SWA2_9HYPH|nr:MULTISPECIES: hypothetical protein [Methylobacterium]PIU06518.1 MAG: hypothetical protein COT56_09400 [Methylobacterium sp. CG09_land_8_20_14_0_10_71_15]PIU16397.1 MAG: hypothetical protein COT28_00170 [Methylobacterium sp. CG08_land_8_20_14_0_20_71_15]GBU16477.1 hypothetical protein AwMethylo_06920 [Methylobacterium sp.]GJE06084.1 hypothetical protein AOPFMNJM_1390 [Methylobacterium jeotgali]
MSDNVIRPVFGTKRPPGPAAPAAGPERASSFRPLQVFGEAAGHLVGLVRDEAGPEGPVLRVVIGPLSGDSVEAVSVHPVTPEGETDAGAAGMAVLRALEILERGGPRIA